MNTPWQKGDLALCVNDRPLDQYPAGRHLGGLRAGAVYTVERVTSPREWMRLSGIGLVLVGVRSSNPMGDFHHSRFRKIEPHTPDTEDAETIRLMTGNPVEVV